MAVDTTARVEDGARIGEDVSIGPYCVVGRDVTLGDGCKLVSHVSVLGHTTIGARTLIYPFASIGGAPQSTAYRGQPTRLVIGADCTIRESVTMNTGTEEGGGLTQVGDRGYFMSYSHVAHDCRVGNDVVFANGVAVGGHCVVGDCVSMGGLAAVHQFSHIGAYAMISGVTGVRRDVIPFAIAAGARARLAGINLVGMRRHKFTAENVRAVRKAYSELFSGEGNHAARVENVERTLGHDPAVAQIVAFVRADRRRALCFPGGKNED